MLINSLNLIKLVDRDQYICEICKDKKVLHLGATDSPNTEIAILNKTFLHAKLCKLTTSLIGMDIDKDMIDWLKTKQGVENIQFGSVEIADDYPKGDFDIVVVGEIIEHLQNPGMCLAALRENISPQTKVIVTVPNAYSLKGFIRALFGHELIHPDHVLHHSPYTLKSLLQKHGFIVEDYFGFVNSGRGFLGGAANAFINLNPRLAEGIGVICRPI